MDQPQQSTKHVGDFRWRRLNPANQAFVSVIAVAAAPVVLLSVAACGVLGFVAYRLSTEGVSALTTNGELLTLTRFGGHLILA